MDPDLTFQPSMKELRCQGYFTNDFDTCSFIAQIHRVQPQLAATDESTEYICELRRTSVNGRDSFDLILNKVAVSLKKAGHAEKYANGFQIYPQLSDETSDFRKIEWSSENCPIRLSTDSSRRLISLITKRTYPQYCETLRLLAKCSAASRGNRAVLSKSHELSEVVIKELRTPHEPGACLNALKLIELGVVAHNEALSCIANTMLVYCAKKPKGFKGLRSQAIENAALGSMRVVSKTMTKNEKREAIVMINCCLLGKLRDELFHKVYVIFNIYIVEL